MFINGTYDRAARAGRYREVAAEYTGMSEDAADPFLGSYYLRIAEEYLAQSQGELRALEQERITALASCTDMPSPPAAAQSRQLAQNQRPPQDARARPTRPLLQRGAIAGTASNILPGSGPQFHNNEAARQSLYAETRLIRVIFGDGARSGATAMRTAKRDSPGAQCVHEGVIAVHIRLGSLPTGQTSSAMGPTESVQFCTDAAAATNVRSSIGRGSPRE
jgi:hypothetical protein